MVFCSPEIIIISGRAEAREIPPSEGVADWRRAGMRCDGARESCVVTL